MASDNTRISLSERFVAGELHLGAWSYVKKAIGFLDTFFILRSLSLYQFGVYQLLLSFYAFLSDIVLETFSSVVYNDIGRSVGEGNERAAKRLFCEHALFRIGFALLAFLTAVAAVPFIPDSFGEEAVRWLLLLAATVVAESVVNIALAILGVRLRFAAMASRPTVQKLFEFAVLAYFFFGSGLTITGILVAKLLSLVGVLVFFAPSVLKAYAPWRGLAPSAERIFPRVLRAYGFWEVPQLFMRNLVGKLRPWIIRLFIGTEFVGVFGVANTGVALLRDLLPTRTLSGIIPRKAAEVGYAARFFRYGTKYLTLAALALALAGAAGYPVAVNLLFPHLAASIPIFYILLPTMVIFAFTKVLNILLVVERRQNLVFYHALLYNALTLTSVAAFLRFFGAAGLAWGDTVGYFLATAGKYWYVTRIGFLPRLTLRDLTSFGAEDRKLMNIFFRHAKDFFRRSWRAEEKGRQG